jgi:hypothetical protein
MPPRRTQLVETPPDLPQEKSCSFLKSQLVKLQDLKEHNYGDSEGAEDEWVGLTEKLVIRPFRNGSTNYRNFRSGDQLGSPSCNPVGGNHAHNQRNLKARMQEQPKHKSN